MAQSALTVTTPSPTPPTNMQFTGATGPNPPNYTKNTYEDYRPDTDFDTAPPPYFDDGTAGPLQTFAANTAALASGSGATAGGTEGSYPGTANGAVPASTSAAHEASGTEVTVLAPGNISHTYPVGTLDMSRTVSVGPALTAASIAAGPNASHASSLSGSAVPTLSAATGADNVSGVGTTVLTVTGTNYNRGSVVSINGIPQTTNYTSTTTLTVQKAMKRTTAGTLPVTVTSNGATTAPVNWTLT